VTNISQNFYLQFGGKNQLAQIEQTYASVTICIAVRSLTCNTAKETHVPYGITQCYLPPDRGDIPAFIPAEAGTRLRDPGEMQS